MKVIVSHTNIDFDGLASLVAAKRLDPEAIAAIGPTKSSSVTAYLNLYIECFPLVPYHDIDWEQVSSILFVDCATLERAGLKEFPLNESIKTSSIDIICFHLSKVVPTSLYYLRNVENKKWTLVQ
ncbi:hypothetical protein [Bacillus sp. JCM 19041]|uniref:hypothetical protein n=1 Tax=Bacillus sp. JCM 19041 TaxID=1460637 RepID=UPI0006CFB9AC